MLAFLGVVLAVAQAHPFDSALTGQQLTLHVGQGRLRADYLVEVPARDAVRWLVEERRKRPDEALEDIEADVISRELSSYADGLRLVVAERVADVSHRAVHVRVTKCPSGVLLGCLL